MRRRVAEWLVASKGSVSLSLGRGETILELVSKSWLGQAFGFKEKYLEVIAWNNDKAEELLPSARRLVPESSDYEVSHHMRNISWSSVVTNSSSWSNHYGNRYYSTSVVRDEDDSGKHTVLGTSDFKKIRLLSDAFIDRSEFVKTWYEEGHQVCLNTYPRRFFKSTLEDTVKTFFEVEVDELGVPLAVEERQNRKLFEGGEVYVENLDRTLLLEPLAIASNARMMRLQGEVPVISVDFKDVSGAALSGMKKLVHRAFLDHKYLLHSIKLHTNEIEVFAK